MHLRHGRNNIPTELLRSFAAIADHGSFSKAAEELKLSQPAISAQVKRLQKIVGGDLFVRQAVGLGLTELGFRVESFARRILRLNDQVIAMAGRGPGHETINLGIQSVFARKILADVVHKCSTSTTFGKCRFVCGSAPDLADKLKSGYLDLVFTLAQTDARRNLVADWNEKLAWTSAEHFVVDTSEPIPFIGRAAGFIDRKALQILDDHDVPYRIAFVAEDLSSLSAAVEAGIGVMVVPERVVPAPLIVVRDSVLPMLPDLRAGVFFSEGFDLKRNKQLVESFVSAVQPLPVATNRTTDNVRQLAR